MAYLLLTLTTLFWAGNFVLGRAMHLLLPPISMAQLRWSLALLLVLPVLLPRLIANRHIIRQHWKILLLLSALSVASFNTLIYIGLGSTTAMNATLLQSAIPIMILVMGRLFFSEAITLRQWLGVGSSLLGVLLLILQGDMTQLLQMQLNRGDLWVLGGMLCWAGYSILLRWRPAGLDGFTFFGVTVTAGVLMLLPFTLFELASTAVTPVFNLDTLAAITYMAICPSILAYLFWNRGVAELGAARAGLFIHLMPLFGILLSAVFLGERVQSYHILGMVLIFTGIYLAVVSGALKRIRRS